MSKPHNCVPPPKVVGEAESTHKPDSRRGFLQGSSLILAGAVPSAFGSSSTAAEPSKPESAENSNSPQIRIGLVGCGFRGLKLLSLALQSSVANVQVTALADYFPDKLQQTLRTLKSQFGDRVGIAADCRFVGLDSVHRMARADVDAVVLATPPAFRPEQTELLIEAKKHVYAESPVAVDALGCARFEKAARIAQEHRVALGTGFEKRDSLRYRETIERLQRHAIGNLTYARLYSCRSPFRPLSRKRSQSDLEHQLRNWQRFAWAGGESIVESQVSQIDTINWLLNALPLEAQGSGGFSSPPPDAVNPPDPHGTKSDRNGLSPAMEHHNVEFVYPRGFRVFSMTRQRLDSWQSVAEFIHATDGWCNLTAGEIYDADDNLIWKSESPADGSQQRIDAFLANLNSPDQLPNPSIAADSTLSAILGREASVTGKRTRWRDCFASSELAPRALAQPWKKNDRT